MNAEKQARAQATEQAKRTAITARTSAAVATSASASTAGAAIVTNIPGTGSAFPSQPGAAIATPGPATTSQAQSWSPPDVPSPRVDVRIERLLAVMETYDPSPRGPAIVALARFMVSRHRASEIVTAVELAADLLSMDDEHTMRVLLTLLNDGWTGSLGELLSCARTV